MPVLLFVLKNQLFHQLHSLLEGQIPRLGLLDLGLERVVLPADRPPDVLLHTGPGVLTLPLELARLALHPLLEHHIIPGLENLPENFLAAPGIRHQQLEKIPLGNHGDLRKLAAVQADDADDLLIDLSGPGHQAAIRQVKLRLRLLGGGAAAPLGRALILRVAADGVGLAAIGKDQLHLGGRLRLSVLGAEHGRVPVFSAGLPIEGVGNGVKNGGFARAGVAGDEVQALPAQFFQIHHHCSGVGAKGGYRQFQWSHGSPSQMRSIRLWAKVRGSSPIGCPFCFS